MSKHKKRKRRFKIKKKRKHNPLTYSPPIKPNPTYQSDSISSLPEIITDCETQIDREAISMVKKRLNFADHNDLRNLKCVRIVNPDRIKMPSKKLTTACYFEAYGTKMAEIWISSDLLISPGKIENLFNKITKKDSLFETLFHELGHHKAKLVHSVDKFENEAYAERYMLGYKKYWRKVYGASKIVTIPFRIFIRILRSIVICILFFFKNRNQTAETYYQYLTQKITLKEFNQQFGIDDANEKSKRKWIHPLRRKKYLERFNLPER